MKSNTEEVKFAKGGRAISDEDAKRISDYENQNIFGGNKIHTFIQLEEPNSKNIRYFMHGIDSKKGFSGVIIDYTLQTE